MPLRRSGDRGAVSGEGQQHRIEEVFPEVESPLTLPFVLKVLIPGAGSLGVLGVMSNVEPRKIVVRLNAGEPVAKFDGPIELIILVGGAVIMAKGNQRLNFGSTLF